MKPTESPKTTESSPYPTPFLPRFAQAGRGARRVVAGVWIDHRRAVIAHHSDQGDTTQTVDSGMETHPGRTDGVCSVPDHESQITPADDSRQRELTQQLDRYYDRVSRAIGAVDTLLIFGPGEAKEELKKRMQHIHAPVGSIELATEDKMTDGQIAGNVRAITPSTHAEHTGTHRD